MPMVYQDNTSVISLVTVRGGVARTKHLRARMHLVQEAVINKKLLIKFVLTSEMVVDGLTKALEGGDFDLFAANALGDKSTCGH